MNTGKTILSYTKIILTILGSPLSALAINKIFPKGIDYVLNLISEYKLVTLLLILLIISLAFIEFVYLSIYKNKLRLKPYFGVYWDRKKNPNPYCPVCKTLLTFDGITDLACFKCKRHIYLADGTKDISYKKAKECVENDLF